MKRMIRGALLGSSILGLGATAGCSGPALEDAAPPPPSYVEAPQYAPPAAAPSGRVTTTELLGGPPPAAQAPQTYAAAPATGRTATMAPIPNPEDLSPAQRARVYGQATPSATAYGSPAIEGPRQIRRERQPDRPRVATTARPAPRAAIAAPAGPVSSRPVVQAPKVAAPKVATPAPAKPAAVAPAKPAPAKPAVVAAKPAAPTPQVAAKPAAPVVAAKPAIPAKPKTKAEQLGAALAAEINAGAKLDIPAGLGAGQETVVVLSLPDTLLARTQEEAAKVGFTVPARTVDARAILTGEGYTIVPNASQAARLKAGEATTIAWQVKPAEGAKGPLKVVISGELKGGAKPQAFPITEIEQAVVAPAPAPVAKKGFSFKDLFAKKDKAADAVDQAADATADAASKAGDIASDGADVAKTKAKGILEALQVPGKPTLPVPGVGAVQSGIVVLAGLVLLLVLLLAALGSRASAKRRAAERRRKFRTMADFNSSSDAPVTVVEAPAVVVDEHREHENA